MRIICISFFLFLVLLSHFCMASATASFLNVEMNSPYWISFGQVWLKHSNQPNKYETGGTKAPWKHSPLLFLVFFLINSFYCIFVFLFLTFQTSNIFDLSFLSQTIISFLKMYHNVFMPKKKGVYLVLNIWSFDYLPRKSIFYFKYLGIVFSN